MKSDANNNKLVYPVTIAEIRKRLNLIEDIGI